MAEPARTPPVETEEPEDMSPPAATAIPNWALALALPIALGMGGALYAGTSSRAEASEQRASVAIAEVKTHQERDATRLGALEADAARKGAQLDAIERSSARIEAAVHDLAAEIAAQKGTRR